MEAIGSFARGSVALAAFLLLFFAIANATAGRLVAALVTLATGLAATAFLVRTRAPETSDATRETMK